MARERAQRLIDRIDRGSNLAALRRTPIERGECVGRSRSSLAPDDARGECNVDNRTEAGLQMGRDSAIGGSVAQFGKGCAGVSVSGGVYKCLDPRDDDRALEVVERQRAVMRSVGERSGRRWRRLTHLPTPSEP